MAVLVEGISIVIRAEAVAEKFPGGWDALQTNPPNGTLCADGELVRLGFMAPPDAAAYGQWLERFGIRYLVNGRAADLVVADQRTGFTAPCDWAEFGHVHLDGDPNKVISACRMVGSLSNEVVMPDGWVFEESLSHKHTFVLNDLISEFLDFKGRRENMDVYTDIETGKHVYIGRVSPRQT